MTFCNSNLKSTAISMIRLLFGLVFAATTSTINYAQTSQPKSEGSQNETVSQPRPIDFSEYVAEDVGRDILEDTAATASVDDAEVPDERTHFIRCQSYGFTQGTSEFGNCMLQLRRERIALQIEQIRYLRQAIAAAEAQTQALKVAEAQRKREAQAERFEREADERAQNRATSESLRQLSENLACPKQGPGLFASPVAGCGSNKHAPRPATTNVRVNVATEECRYRTAAGCRRD